MVQQSLTASQSSDAHLLHPSVHCCCKWRIMLCGAGAYAAVECAITPNDLIKAESGAMVTMSSGVEIEAKLEGSAGAACLRSCCAGTPPRAWQQQVD